MNRRCSRCIAALLLLAVTRLAAAAAPTPDESAEAQRWAAAHFAGKPFFSFNAVKVVW